MKNVKAIALVVLPLAATAVSGWANAQQPSDFRPGFYLGGAVGRADADDTCPGCDDKDTAWKVFGGYQFNRTLGVELGYTDFGSFGAAATPAGLPAGTADAKAVEVTAVGTIPVGQRFGVFGKIGAYRFDADNTATGQSDKGNDITYGAGVRYDFTRNVAGRLEWQRYMDMGTIAAGRETDVDVLGLGVQVQW